MNEQGETQDSKLPDWLPDRINRAADDARTANILYASLVGYCALTIVTTSDRQIILNETVRLPLVDLEVSLIGFFILSPILIISVYLYLQLQLNRLKTLIADHKSELNRAQNVPADPWPMGFEGDKTPHPIHRLHHIIVNIALWWLLPGLLWLFCFWILRSHNTLVAVLNCVYLIIGTSISLYFWSHYKRIARVMPPPGNTGQILLTITTFIFICPVLLFIVLAESGVLWSNRESAPSNWERLYRGWTSVDLSYQILGSKTSKESDEAFAADLRRVRLQAANLVASTLESADLRESQLQRAQLSHAILKESNLSGANLTGANLEGATLRGANLQGAILSGANLREANLRGAILQDANLEGALLQFADLRGANLIRAKLQSSNLYYADLQNADLKWAMLCNADLGNTNMQETNLGSANLNQAILIGANLREAILRKTYLGKIKIQDKKVFLEKLRTTATLYGLEFDSKSELMEPFQILITADYIFRRLFFADMEAVWIHLAQKTLKEKGLYYGDVDRIAGPITIRALIQYQKNYDLEPTGVIDAPTRSKMGMSEGEDKISDCVRFPQDRGEECVIEMPGSVRRGLDALEMDVKEVKSYLNKLGYYTGEINSRYDMEFIEGVLRFQAAMNIYADGLLGEGTARTIDSVDLGKLHPIISTRRAKTILHEKDYFNGTIDDYYDDDFVTAFKRFQADKCLIYDGLLRQSVVDELESDR